MPCCPSKSIRCNNSGMKPDTVQTDIEVYVTYRLCNDQSLRELRPRVSREIEIVYHRKCGWLVSEPLALGSLLFPTPLRFRWAQLSLIT